MKRHLRVVGDRPRRRWWPFLVVSFVLTGLLVFGVVTLQVLVNQTSFRMQRLGERNDLLEQQYGQMKLEIAQLSAPGRINREARRLGLVLPAADQVQPLAVPDLPRPVASVAQPDGASFALKNLLGGAP